MLHTLLGNEYPFGSVLSLDQYSLTLIFPLKSEFIPDIFSRIYIHLVVDDHKTTGVVNKDTSTLEDLRWICLSPHVK